jgi:hypothetical protein
MTAVEWILDWMGKNQYFIGNDLLKAVNKAKEMEKEQMWQYIESNYVNGENSLSFHKKEFEQYYNETFKSE